ncbi:MAG: hypothetical protein AABZ08_08785 [Planctomycetota bacterium]
MSGQFDRIVQPGQSGKIPLKITTGHSTGPISKSVTVITNIPGAGSTLALQMKGELWQIMQATPNSALFGNVSAQQTKEGTVLRKLTVTNNGETPTKLGELKSNNPAFKPEIKELEPGKKWELTVGLGIPLPTGVQSGMIELQTGLTELPKLQIACSAYLVADVDVVPNKMMIPAARSINLQRDFYVRNNATKPLKVYEVTASSPQMKVGMQETQTGMSYRITMDVPPDYKPTKDGDKITFKTDNPNYPTMTIPISEQASPPNSAVMSRGPTTTGPAIKNPNAPVIQSTIKGTPTIPKAGAKSTPTPPVPTGGK